LILIETRCNFDGTFLFIDKSGPTLKRLFFISIVILCFFYETQQVFGQRSWTFDLFLGDAYCFNMPLVIEQEGYEKIELTAHYRTESFKLPVYYSCKIGTAKETRGWELELIHLKIILTNNPPEVQQFEISHGYNYITINRIWDLNLMILRFGMGTILSNPDNTIRNMMYDTDQGLLNRGYHISGPGLQIAAEKRITIFSGFFFSLEVKAAASIAKVGIAEGNAIVPQAGFHGLFGIGYTFD
jgi:hypothetical protein